GSGSVASPTKTTGPNWLSFSPTPSGTRSFPILSTILAGLNVTGPLPGGDAGANIEALSSVSRTLNFRVTVRDNHPYVAGSTIGQTSFKDVVVTVTNTAGPFAVTSPNTNIIWPAGSSATVTWSVNNTNTGSVNCANVNILLSTDGGNTFTALLSNTPNDGSQLVNVPNTPGTTNRIKVEAVGNIFFDISNTNFSIGAAPSCSDPAGLNTTAITTNSATVSWNAVAGAVSYDVDYKAASSGTWINAASNTALLSVNLAGLAASTLYDWRVRADCSGGSSNYVQTQFTTTAASCNAPAGLNTTAITTSSATLNWNAVASAVSYDADYKAASSGIWINAATNTASLSVNLTGLAASTLYDWRVRADCSGGSSNYVQTQFTTSAAGGACPGPYDVSTNGTTGGAATVPFNTDVKGTITSRNDNDYYRFTISTDGTITLSLTTLPANYQLALLNNGGSQIAVSQNNGTANETINRTVSADTYYARVFPKGNASNASSCYTLRVQTGTASRNLDDITSLRLVPGNAFGLSLFPNPAKQTLNVSLEGMSNKAEIKVYNIMGNLVIRQVTNKTSTELNVSKLAAGVYMVSASDGITTSNSKFVKE
ncbi:MAG TPA: fibronectin type III domain-containing protein, partial [Chitinophagaceae bacterium]|nr:fibronectin type III domain-containing protein [Chitinophagaceae bacterium]